MLKIHLPCDYHNNFIVTLKKNNFDGQNHFKRTLLKWQKADKTQKVLHEALPTAFNFLD